MIVTITTIAILGGGNCGINEIEPLKLELTNPE